MTATCCEIAVPRDRLYTSMVFVVLSWMVGTALITLAIAMLFLRNQVRSLRRLAIAADAFGRGLDVPSFRPQGATEVRQAAAAFLSMRLRIQRQIAQRTEMLAGISHDLRTPLTRMRLELELHGRRARTCAGLKSDVAEMLKMVEAYLELRARRGRRAGANHRPDEAPGRRRRDGAARGRSRSRWPAPKRSRSRCGRTRCAAASPISSPTPPATGRMSG